nr:transporter substrate-binding domain-containing protein [Desulfospira joergensenii]
MQRVAEKLDIHLEMQYAPFARRLLLMKSGEIDIMGGLLKRRSRQSYIYFVSPPYVKSSRKIFFVRKGEAKRIQSYGDLYGLEIGTKINSKYFPRFDQDEKLKKQPVSSVEQNFRKLLLKRIDAVIYSYRSGYTTMMKMGITDQVEPAIYYFAGKNSVYIGISKKSPLMAEKDRVEAVVKEMVDSGEMESLIKKFYDYLPKNR